MPRRPSQRHVRRSESCGCASLVTSEVVQRVADLDVEGADGVHVGVDRHADVGDAAGVDVDAADDDSDGLKTRIIVLDAPNRPSPDKNVTKPEF